MSESRGDGSACARISNRVPQAMFLEVLGAFAGASSAVHCPPFIGPFHRLVAKPFVRSFVETPRAHGTQYAHAQRRCAAQGLRKKKYGRVDSTDSE
jgi:hypothetical protein